MLAKGRMDSREKAADSLILSNLVTSVKDIIAEAAFPAGKLTYVHTTISPDKNVGFGRICKTPD